ncbi:hypothetical protein Ancab_007546 [Ancistrocladus abbreviatus]
MTLVGQSYGALQQGFYNGKCGKNNVEQVIFNVIWARFRKDLALVAALLRMQFYDCCVRGCDASILLDRSNTKKNAGANGGVREYEVIDAAKAAVEKLCPGVFSCADVIVIASRVTVWLDNLRQSYCSKSDELISGKSGMAGASSGNYMSLAKKNSVGALMVEGTFGGERREEFNPYLKQQTSAFMHEGEPDRMEDVILGSLPQLD